MNYSKLRGLQKMNKVSNREIAPIVGLTDTGYAKMIDNETCTVATLELIAGYFKVSISYFFDSEEKKTKSLVAEEMVNKVEEPCTNCAALQKKIDQLNKDLIESQKETIAALRGETKIRQSN